LINPEIQLSKELITALVTKTEICRRNFILFCRVLHANWAEKHWKTLKI
jgi:hypothetical protein